MPKSPTRSQPAWPAWILLALGLALTALATAYTYATVASANRRGLAAIGAEIALKIETRLHAHALLLRDAAAFLGVSGQVDRAHWRDYVAQARVELNLPGVQGLGFALSIPPGRLSEHLREVRAEGFPDYRVWPEGERPLYSAIVYLEPFAGRNLRAFGYDMFSEPVRRAAMERARDQDVAALSGKVLLVQETATDVQAGTLMYVPAFGPGLPTDTLAQRRAALFGWVYSPFRMNDLMHGILGGWGNDGGRRVRLAVYDGDRVAPAALLYDSQAEDRPGPAPASADGLRLPIDFNGQRWTLSFSQSDLAASAGADPRVWLVAGGGSVIAILLAGLLRALTAARSRALRLVAELAARQRAEQALREAERKYREIFETSPVGLYRSTPQGRYIDVNGAFAGIFGYATAEALVAGVSDIGSQLYARPEDREILTRRLAREDKVTGYEVEAKRLDGQPVWVSVDASAVRDALGTIVAYHGAMTDITERVQGTVERDAVSAVARLAVSSESAERFRQALPPLLSTRLGFPVVGVETYDAAHGEMVLASAVGIPAVGDGPLRVPVGQALSGRVAASGEALVETAADARPDYAFAALKGLGVASFVCAPLKLGSRVLGTLSLADSRPRPDAQRVVATLLTIADTAADAIERLEAQAALRESERNYRALVDNLYAGVVVHAPDTSILFANPMALQLLGVSAEQMRGGAAIDPAWCFIREDGTRMPVHEYPVGRVAASGAAVQNLFLGIVRPDRAGPVWVQCEAHPIRDDRDGLQRIVVTFFDVTERKTAEAELDRYRQDLESLVQSRTLELSDARDAAESANRAKSTFLANMSHEIRTPMNAIIGLTHLLQREIAEPKSRDRLVKIGQSAQHLLGILNDILDLSKIDAGRLALARSDFSLSQVLGRTADLLHERAAAKGLGVVVEIDPDCPARLHGDALRLGQMATNYLSNAIEFSERGEIWVRALVLEDAPAGILLRIEVQDQGIGLTQAQQARLFHAFVQADDSTTRLHGGTGLGLAIVQRLAALMGGQAGLTSAPGAGSTFWLTARLGRASTAAEAPPAARGESAEETLARRHRGRRLLLAEDEPINRMVACDLLGRLGLIVELAENGQEAVERVRTGDYALVLMDIQMPVMNGLDAARAIRALPGKGSVPILAMTASAFAEDRQRCLEAGMNDHIGKPVVPERLFETLLRWLPAAGPTEPAETAGDAPPAPAAPVDWDQVRTALDRLERLLADSDIRAQDLWRECAPLIKDALGPPATRLAHQIADYDYAEALASLRAMRV